MICAQYASTLSQTELTLTESENHDKSETVCSFALCGVMHSFSPLTESESAVDSCMMSLGLWICYGYGSESARVCYVLHSEPGFANLSLLLTRA